MFLKIYKTTFKNIFRSATFWMFLALFGFIAYEILTQFSHGYYDRNLGEMIYDTDPRFVLAFQTYVKLLSNTIGSKVLFYAMPLFATVTTVLVLNRDHGDNYFGIEKAAGVKPAKYVIARLSALFTLNLIVVTIVSYLFLHLYVFTRGGVDNMELREYITDSTPRMMRMIIFRAVPTIVFYIGFTYCIGSLFKSGIVAAICSIGYVIIYAAGYLMLRMRVAPTYWDYLSPTPNKLTLYFHYYDSEWFEGMLQQTDTSLEKAAFCICLLTGLGIIYSLVAYICTKVRDK